jgi:hypothetical protein
MKNCENCEILHNESYGSGRFCSLKCARSFSTKSKRKDINQKVSDKLTGTGNNKVSIICKNCNNLFIVPWSNRNHLCCSRSCASSFTNKNKDVKNKLSLARIESIKKGKVNGNSIKCTYTFKGVDIHCDSKVEKSCLNYFDNLGASLMRRCDIVIFYNDNGINRRFLPDFYIELDNDIYIVEAKSYMAINSINEKWRDYNRKSILKKTALISYCNDHNMKYFWYTKDMNIKYYNEI